MKGLGELAGEYRAARRRTSAPGKGARVLLSLLVAVAGCQEKASLGPKADSGIPSFAACATSGECIALVRGCCGTCGAPTLSDVAGVNSSRQDAFRAATCTDAHPVCPKCAQTQEPNLIATCMSDQCTPVDVREDTISACASDDDCRVRYPECCESCEARPGSLIAIAKRYAGLYAAEACRPEQECPACAPAYPPDASAVCEEDGHCRVATPAPPN